MTMLPGRPMVVKCAYISFCACFGTLARLYTDDIGPASNLALQGSFLANSVGSFALGILTSSPDRDSVPDALHAGLTVVRKLWRTSVFPLAVENSSARGWHVVKNMSSLAL